MQAWLVGIAVPAFQQRRSRLIDRAADGIDQCATRDSRGPALRLGILQEDFHGGDLAQEILLRRHDPWVRTILTGPLRRRNDRPFYPTILSANQAAQYDGCGRWMRQAESVRLFFFFMESIA